MRLAGPVVAAVNRTCGWVVRVSAVSSSAAGCTVIHSKASACTPRSARSTSVARRTTWPRTSSDWGSASEMYTASASRCIRLWCGITLHR